MDAYELVKRNMRKFYPKARHLNPSNYLAGFCELWLKFILLVLAGVIIGFQCKCLCLSCDSYSRSLIYATFLT